MRYAKKLLASAFYCGAIVLVIYVANYSGMSLMLLGTTGSTQAQQTSGIGGFISLAESRFLVSVAAPLAAVGAVSTVKSMINEAFGA